MRTNNLIHPGEILEEKFLKPMGISQTKLALDIRVPAPRINAIVRGKRSIAAETALRLGAYFDSANANVGFPSQAPTLLHEASIFEALRHNLCRAMTSSCQRGESV